MRAAVLTLSSSGEKRWAAVCHLRVHDDPAQSLLTHLSLENFLLQGSLQSESMVRSKTKESHKILQIRNISHLQLVNMTY